MLAVRDREQIVGTLTLQTKKPWAIDVAYFTPCKKALYLINMAVAPERQRIGVGRALLDGSAERRAIVSRRRHPPRRLRGAGRRRASSTATAATRSVGGKSYRGVPLLYFELMTGAAIVIRSEARDPRTRRHPPRAAVARTSRRPGRPPRPTASCGSCGSRRCRSRAPTLTYIRDAVKGQSDGHMLPWAVRDLTDQHHRRQHPLSRHRPGHRSRGDRLHLVRAALPAHQRQHHLQAAAARARLRLARLRRGRTAHRQLQLPIAAGDRGARREEGRRVAAVTRRGATAPCATR